MPKVKSFHNRSTGERILDVMAYHQSRLELSHKELAQKIAMPYETLLRRKKRPEKFTLGELVRISKAFNVPLVDFISGHTGM